jgi:HEAT repeat protein
VRGGTDERAKQNEPHGRDHPSPLPPLAVKERGEPASQSSQNEATTEQQFIERLIPLLRHPAFVPRVYVALTLGRLHSKEALPAIVEIIREGYAFSDSTALASGKHFDQSQTVRWRGFLCLALGRLGSDEARVALESLVAEAKQPRDIRYCSAVGLGFIGSAKSLPILGRVAAADAIWMVRDAAQWTAESIQTMQMEARK